MKATADDILQIIRDQQLVRNPIGLRPDMALFTSGLVDSFGAAALISAVERRFMTSIDVSRLTPQTFDTPEQIARFVSDA